MRTNNLFLNQKWVGGELTHSREHDREKMFHRIVFCAASVAGVRSDELE